MTKVIYIPLLLLAVSHTPRPLTTSWVSAVIHKKGAAAALQTIYQDSGTWLALLRGIATGKENWLSIANQLHPVSDAGASEQLELAVGEALEHRPANVLRLAVPVFSVESACSGPDVDDARYDSYERSMRAISKRQAMLRRIDATNLKRVRDRCIQRLEESRAGIAYFYGKTNQPPN